MSYRFKRKNAFCEDFVVWLSSSIEKNEEDELNPSATLWMYG